ncbi:B3 domain-containing transcription factor LEC2-like [Curcuma longa]|uniref:B3 domain-containing transcription factor LEC2-like n=1 Tax=Curcuma longa TaxID=136217 RepID=UPI003D9F7E0D
MDGSSRYRESEEYCNRGRSSDKVVEFGEFLFPGTYCDRGNSGQTKTINEQIKCHSTPRNEIGSCKQFTSAAMENPSIADLEMLQSGNSFSELLSGNAYLGSVLQPNTRYLPQMITNYAFPVPCMSFARSSDLSVVDGKNEELMSNRECGALRAWKNNEQATLQIGNRSTFPTDSEVTDDKELGCKDLQVALCKELTKSDVGNTGRIVLPKREAEACLPPLSERDGIVLHMEDMTLQCSWKFKYRFWPNNRSRMYILENTGDFVRAHCLQTGDSLIIYRNSTSGNFFVRGKKANPEQSPMDLAKWNWKNQFSTDEEHCSSSMYNK